MEKPIEEWYELLPEPIRSEALEARKKSMEYANCRRTATSLHAALYCGLAWSVEGGCHSKWEAIYKRAKAGEFDPKPTAAIDADAAVATITAMRERIAELERENKEMAGSIKFGEAVSAIAPLHERIAELESKNKAMAEKIYAMSKILNP